MNLSWLKNMIDNRVQHLQDDPEYMFSQDMITFEEYKNITNRNAFVIHQFLELEHSIKDFIKQSNGLVVEWNEQKEKVNNG